MDTTHEPSNDLFLAFVIGAAAALYVILPPTLRSAAHHGAVVGLVLGIASALVRRRLAAAKPTWLRSGLQIPPFVVGSAAGFVAMIWLSDHLPRWLAAIAS